MKLADAPQSGWYPDPEGGGRLRWWDGSDWSDYWRAPPAISASDRTNAATIRGSADPHGAPSHLNLPVPPGFPAIPQMHDGAQLVEQVRLAARSEADRAAQMFGAQARHATRVLTPLISEYTNKFSRLVKRLALLAIVLTIAWFVFQAWANMSLFEWVGDRIDNLADDTAMARRWTPHHPSSS